MALRTRAASTEGQKGGSGSREVSEGQQRRNQLRALRAGGGFLLVFFVASSPFHLPPEPSGLEISSLTPRSRRALRVEEKRAG